MQDSLACLSPEAASKVQVMKGVWKRAGRTLAWMVPAKTPRTC